MTLLYRGVCEHLDRINDGKLKPRGRLSHVSMTRGDLALLIKQGKEFSEMVI